MTERDEITGHRVDAKDQTSIDTARFEDKLAALMMADTMPLAKAMRSEFIAHINAWGAEQRNKGVASQAARVQCLEHESKALAIAKQALLTITFSGPATAVGIATKALAMMFDAGANAGGQGKACAASAPVRAALTDEHIRNINSAALVDAIRQAGTCVGNGDVSHMTYPIIFARAIIAADRAQPAITDAQMWAIAKAKVGVFGWADATFLDIETPQQLGDVVRAILAGCVK